MSDRKPVIFVDMDGVLVDLLPAWLEVYHDVGGEHVLAEAITSYRWEDSVLNKELFLQAINSGIPFHIARPLPEAVEGFRALGELTPHVHVVTKMGELGSRGYDAKLGWMWRFIHPALSKDQISFNSAKHLMAGDYLIEDAPENVARWLNSNPAAQAFLVDQPYNREYTHERCTRVKSLLEAALLIAAYEVTKSSHTVLEELASK